MILTGSMITNFQSKTKSNTPWVTNTLLKSINKKNKLYQQYLVHPTEMRKTHSYQIEKMCLLVFCVHPKKRYFTRKFEMEKNNIHNTWKVINSVLNNKTTSHNIGSIIQDGNVIDNPAKIANNFNDYFVNIGPNLAHNIPSNSSPIGDYLNYSNHTSLFFTPVTEFEVIDIVNSLITRRALVMIVLILQ